MDLVPRLRTRPECAVHEGMVDAEISVRLRTSPWENKE